MEQLYLKHLNVVMEKKSILIVEQISLSCGKIYGIVGPSGSGKSTLLRVVNLLQKPHAGTMNYWGEEVDLASLPHAKALAIQRQMAFVAQQPVMFHTSVFDNVAMGLRYRKLDRKTIRQRVSEALELVDLGDRIHQQAATLSGGEAQRAALARAIVLKPRLLLLDEPTASLDPANVSIFEQVIKGIHRQTGMTIMIVTHNLPQAKRLADHCLFVHKGRIVESADTSDFFAQPKSQELEDFISGRMIY
ncbi:phosphate ABC transporter ATP-binding protein [Brevibacillus sp. B_LB10_24]|uniref:ABC transporter ATP-binding protein n=1 Tax=Brevibacillus sp. B_LB10_24 TaxID=3380645 RepID=UPI0038BC231F